MTKLDYDKTLNPQDPENANTTYIRPSDEVLVPFSINDSIMKLADDNPAPNPFNVAYADAETAKMHCWWLKKDNMTIELRKMTARDFIKMNFESGAMNPFEQLNKLKFLQQYHARFSLSKED